MKTCLLFIQFYIIVLVSFSQHWCKNFSVDSSTISNAKLVAYAEDFYVGCNITDTSNSFFGFALTRLDSQGIPKWLKKYSFSSTPHHIIDGPIISTDGNLLILLNYGFDIAIMKTDTAGNFLWGKNYFLGYYSVPYYLAETKNGDIYIAGIDENISTYNTFLLHLDHNGIYIDCKDVASTFQWNNQTYPKVLIATRDGGVLLVTSMNMIWPDNNIYFFKLDSNNVIEWTSCIGGPIRDWATCVTETSDGFIYSGRQDNKLILGKIDLKGNPTWTKLFPSFSSIATKNLVVNDRIIVWGRSFH
jgi:hypothetical protein